MAQEKWLVEDEKTIDLETVTSLKVALVAGKIDIIGHDEPWARVEVHSVRGKALQVSFEDGVLEIDHPQLRWDNFVDVLRSFSGSASAEVSIMVPRNVALKFGVVSATALISGLVTGARTSASTARISTVSGDVVVDSHIGDLDLNAVNGEFSVSDHTGRISARTVSGDVTATGAITRFISDGVSGTVFLDITGVPEEVRVNTVTGGVTARLEPGVAARYRVNTVSGTLQIDDARVHGIRGAYSGSFGLLDKTWLEFTANTVSGDVSVLHSVGA